MSPLRNGALQLTPVPFPLTWLRSLDFPHKLGICERLFGGSLEPRGICWVQTGAGLPWKLNLASPCDRWIVYGKYEGGLFIDWARQFLPPDGVIVDSGANIGQMLMYLGGWVPEGRVLAFEPGRLQADWLEECLAQNSELPVELIRRGLGAANRQVHLRPVGPEYFHGGCNTISETEGEPIQMVRLDEELSSRSIDKVDLWKLDVEGYEIPALEGAGSYLLDHRIRALYVELSGDNGPRVRQFLADAGYQCFFIDRRGKLFMPETFPEHTNGLFLPA